MWEVAILHRALDLQTLALLNSELQLQGFNKLLRFFVCLLAYFFVTAAILRLLQYCIFFCYLICHLWHWQCWWIRLRYSCPFFFIPSENFCWLLSCLGNHLGCIVFAGLLSWMHLWSDMFCFTILGKINCERYIVKDKYKDLLNYFSCVLICG